MPVIIRAKIFLSGVFPRAGRCVYQIERLGAALARQPQSSNDPVERVFDVLVRTTRMLTNEPDLANAMVKSVSSANAATVTDVARIDNMMRRLLLSAAGIRRPTPKDLSIMRVLVHSWRGILHASVNGRTSMREGEADLRLACQSMMAGATSAAASPGSA